MKVLVHASQFNTDGGVGKHVFHLGKGLEDNGISVDYIYGQDTSGTHKTYLQHFNLNHISYDFVLSPFLFKRSVFPNKYDIIHSHAQIAYDSTLVKGNTKVITTLHGTDHGVFSEYQNEVRVGNLAADWRTKLYFNVILRKEKFAHTRADEIISVSNGVAAEAKKYFNRNSATIPNGVDIDEFSPYRDPGGIREYYGIGRDDILILFVGQSDWRKGLNYLLQAFHQLTGGMKLLLVGLPKFQSNQKNIINAGFVSHQELLQIYASADIFCIPSLYEGMALVLLEAMACGKPCVVGKTHGTEILSDKKDAILVNKRDIYGLSEALDTLKDRNTREKIGKEARQTVKQFKWDIMVKKTIEIYERTCE